MVEHYDAKGQLRVAFLGLDIAIWIVLVVYLTDMLLLGWWSNRSTRP
ncbi:MAG: hypothetical protein IH892_12290 [Planctomycetes bacterium]|nr:hypothetical protein [Planctomycetota bacterium]